MDASSGNWLLSTRLRDIAARLRLATDAAARDAPWREADLAVKEAEAEEDADLALPVWERDLDAVERLVGRWQRAVDSLPDWDKAVAKRAFKAYKKRLKLMRLDDASTSGRNPLSAGRESSILGIRPPEQYPPEVWSLLVRQGKLREAGGGLYELATV